MDVRRGRRGRAVAIVGAVVAISTLSASCGETEVRFASEPTQQPAGSESDHVRIAAAGDAVCDAPAGPTSSLCQYAATSDLLVSDDVDAVFMLGDAQYPNGRYGDFLQYYDPTWGRARVKTFPVLGNHEYETVSGEPRGYFRYFGDRFRGPSGHGYYSFELPEGCSPSDGMCWHVIALNSDLCFLDPGCGGPMTDGSASPGQRQIRWLTDDLAAHPEADYPCTIAFFHEPLFYSSGVYEEVRPLWDALYSANVDIVLNGHRHNYERWQPLAPTGVRDDELGMRQFIVGTGGANLEPLGGHPPELAKAQAQAFGVLELDLFQDEYTWRWVPAAGQPTDFKDVSVRPAPCV